MKGQAHVTLRRSRGDSLEPEVGTEHLQLFPDRSGIPTYPEPDVVDRIVHVINGIGL
jgi:hypothetical protein